MAIARAAAGGDDTTTRHARVEAVLRDHHATLLWIARRWSGSAEDADDALQRAMEIYVRRLDTIDAATEFSWLKVVVRHEAMALRRSRLHGVALEADDLAERIAAPDVAVQERIEREERNARSREAMARLKPDERTALLLKAEGYSYREIGERQGWTYTKVNRAITEGRRRFLKVFASIEAGDECERFAPTLLALVQGRAESAAVVELRPHLRHCATCRATVRELHASRRHRLALHLPFVAGIAPVRWLGDRVEDGSPGRWPDVKGVAHGVLNRVTGGDAATSMQLASSGGGRGPAVAALLGLCLSGGAGTYCVATGVFPDPVRIVHDDGRGADQHRHKPARSSHERKRAPSAPTPTPIPVTVASREPTDTSTPSSPDRRQPEQRRKTKRADDADPADEFGFEGTTGSPGGSSAASPTVATAATSAQSGSPEGGSSAPSSTPSDGGSTPSSSPPPTSGGEFMP
jgi:RNA polymerase sigma factor (sigma-70 family)